MRADDCADVARILNDAIEHGVAHFGTELTSSQLVHTDWDSTRLSHPWLIAENDDGGFMGFAKASVWKTRKAYDWTVESGIYIEQGNQGQGVGRALYERLFAILARQGYRVVLAGVSIPNPGSERLHESMGMHIAGELSPVGFKHGEWIPVRIYQRILGDSDLLAPPGPIQSVEHAWNDLYPNEQVSI